MGEKIVLKGDEEKRNSLPITLGLQLVFFLVLLFRISECELLFLLLELFNSISDLKIQNNKCFKMILKK